MSEIFNREELGCSGCTWDSNCALPSREINYDAMKRDGLKMCPVKADEIKNPWDSVEYSIRAYDHIKGEYRDFKLEEVPQDVLAKWLTWRLGELSKAVDETRGLMQLSNKACNGHASEVGRLRERMRAAEKTLKAALLDDGTRGDVSVCVISKRDTVTILSLLHLEEK